MSSFPIFDPATLILTFGYVGLFLIIMTESGLFFGFFLPGDSLLFTAGLLAGSGILDIWTLLLLAPIAAIVGDSIGYWFGNWIGPQLFIKEDSFFFSTKHVERTERFYARYGSKAIVLARFVPIVRTFVSILAGVGSMRYRTFLMYNILGGLLWGAGVPLLGYFLGATFPAIEEHLLLAIAVIIMFSFAPIAVELWCERRKQKN